MQQYLDQGLRILEHGTWVTNERTWKRCRTVINADFEYDMRDSRLPILTTRKMAWKAAIAEMLGYLRGYSSAAQFRELGCNTWDANANENEHWLANRWRKGTDDMGRAYGVQGRSWTNPEGEPIDQLRKIVTDLSKGKDDRREILTFWNPGELDRMCLPACMHTHTFSVLDGYLYLTSYQRSDDFALGHAFNQIQVGWLLLIMAQITGLKPGIAYHKAVNIHLYEDQVPIFESSHVGREPFELPRLVINPRIKSLEDLDTWVTLDDFSLVGYESHPPIRYPFSV